MCEAYTCLMHPTSYSVPASDSAARFDDVKRAPRWTNCGSFDSRSASFACACCTAGFAAGLAGSSPDATAAAFAFAAAAFFSRSMSSGSTVTSLIEKCFSGSGAAMYARHDASSAESGTGSGSSISLRASRPPRPLPLSIPLSSATKKVARSRTSSSLS